MGDELYQITMIGITAVFFIVCFKLILTRFPIPGLAEVAAMV